MVHSIGSPIKTLIFARSFYCFNMSSMLIDVSCHLVGGWGDWQVKDKMHMVLCKG